MSSMAIWFHQPSGFCMQCSTELTEITRETSFFLLCDFADLFRLFWLASHTMLMGYSSES